MLVQWQLFFVFENVTVGHEVLIFWNYEKNWFLTYQNGSFNEYLEYIKDNLLKLVAPIQKEVQANP